MSHEIADILLSSVLGFAVGWLLGRLQHRPKRLESEAYVDEVHADEAKELYQNRVAAKPGGFDCDVSEGHAPRG